MNLRLPCISLHRAFAVLALGLALLASPALAAKKKVAEPETPVLDSVAIAARADSIFRLSQEYASQKFIYTVLAGNLDSLKVLFAEEVRDQVTKDVMEYMQGQYKWFWDMVRGDFELLVAGQRDSSYFREYRIANETNKRYPLVVIQVEFPDSLSTKLIGAQVKNFLGGAETRLTGEQTWVINDKTYDIHSIIVAQLDSVTHIMAVKYFEDDTGKVDQDFITKRGIPLAKEALARGYRDSALAILKGKSLRPDVGVVLIRKDPLAGMVHIKVSFRPEDMGLAPEPTKPEKSKSGKTGKSLKAAAPPKKKAAAAK